MEWFQRINVEFITQNNVEQSASHGLHFIIKQQNKTCHMAPRFMLGLKPCHKWYLQYVLILNLLIVKIKSSLFFCEFHICTVDDPNYIGNMIWKRGFETDQTIAYLIKLNFWYFRLAGIWALIYSYWEEAHSQSVLQRRRKLKRNQLML